MWTRTFCNSHFVVTSSKSWWKSLATDKKPLVRSEVEHMRYVLINAQTLMIPLEWDSISELV